MILQDLEERRRSDLLRNQYVDYVLRRISERKQSSSKWRGDTVRGDQIDDKVVESYVEIKWAESATWLDKIPAGRYSYRVPRYQDNTSDGNRSTYLLCGQLPPTLYPFSLHQTSCDLSLEVVHSVNIFLSLRLRSSTWLLDNAKRARRSVMKGKIRSGIFVSLQSDVFFQFPLRIVAQFPKHFDNDRPSLQKVSDDRDSPSYAYGSLSSMIMFLPQALALHQPIASVIH